MSKVGRGSSESYEQHIRLESHQSQQVAYQRYLGFSVRRWTRLWRKASWWCRTWSRACGVTDTWAPKSTAAYYRGRSGEQHQEGLRLVKKRTSTGGRPGADGKGPQKAGPDGEPGL